MSSIHNGSDLRDIVTYTLDTAVFENEYTNLMTMDAHTLAEDLRTYCAALEKFDIELIKFEVRSYQQWYHHLDKL